MKKKRLFFYSFLNGLQTTKFNAITTRVVSEVSLPKLDKEYADKKCPCAQRSLLSLKTGAIVDLAMCDPIVVRECKILSLEENPVPKKFADSMNAWGSTIIVFLYRGGRVWADRTHTCLLKDLEK
ncbi:MAG: hypothetical protein AAB631_02340 [Patescibacteria group bacterium]